MSKDLQAELEELKRQVAALSVAAASPPLAGAAASAGAEALPESPGAEPASSAPPETSTTQKVLASVKEMGGEIDWNKLSHQVASQLSELANDVNASKPKALAAAFLTGVAVGKVMSK